MTTTLKVYNEISNMVVEEKGKAIYRLCKTLGRNREA